MHCGELTASMASRREEASMTCADMSERPSAAARSAAAAARIPLAEGYGTDAVSRSGPACLSGGNRLSVSFFGIAAESPAAREEWIRKNTSILPE